MRPSKPRRRPPTLMAALKAVIDLSATTTTLSALRQPTKPMRVGAKVSRFEKKIWNKICILTSGALRLPVPYIAGRPSGAEPIPIRFRNINRVSQAVETTAVHRPGIVAPLHTTARPKELDRLRSLEHEFNRIYELGDSEVQGGEASG